MSGARAGRSTHREGGSTRSNEQPSSASSSWPPRKAGAACRRCMAPSWACPPSLALAIGAEPAQASGRAQGSMRHPGCSPRRRIRRRRPSCGEWRLRRLGAIEAQGKGGQPRQLNTSAARDEVQALPRESRGARGCGHRAVPAHELEQPGALKLLVRCAVVILEGDHLPPPPNRSRACALFLLASRCSAAARRLSITEAMNRTTSA